MCVVCQTGAIPVVKWPIHSSLCLNQVSLMRSFPYLLWIIISWFFSRHSIFVVVFECLLIVWVVCRPTTGCSIHKNACCFDIILSGAKKEKGQMPNNTITIKLTMGTTSMAQKSLHVFGVVEHIKTKHWIEWARDVRTIQTATNCNLIKSSIDNFVQCRTFFYARIIFGFVTYVCTLG